MVSVVRVGVGCIVRLNGSILLGRRKSILGSGTLALPGGHLEVLKSQLSP